MKHKCHGIAEILENCNVVPSRIIVVPSRINVHPSRLIVVASRLIVVASILIVVDVFDCVFGSFGQH